MQISYNGKRVIISRLFNLHAHFRQKEVLEFMVRQFIRAGFSVVQAMPNTRPAILTGEDAIRYEKEIYEVVNKVGSRHKFAVIVSMQITEATTPQMIEDALRCGIFMFKIYPKNLTTHSENGVLDYLKIIPLLKVLEGRAVSWNGVEVEAVALFHGETPCESVIGVDKGVAFVEIINEILQQCPDLKITLEHINAWQVVKYVINKRQLGYKIGATITPHHLTHTQDDLLGYTEWSHYMGQPHLFCKPTYRFPRDRDALIKVASTGQSGFFYGGDDAIWLRSQKVANECCNGCFNTFAAVPRCLEIFEAKQSLHNLDNFFVLNAVEHYGLPLEMFPDVPAEFIREENEVPKEIPVPGINGDVAVPWLFGRTMAWRKVGG